MMPTFTMPGLVRAGLGTRPAPVPVPAVLVRVPRPRVAVEATAPRVPAVLDPAVLDPDPVPSAGPQAQGDVIVLPWLDFMAPHVRYLHTASSAPVARAGLTLLDPHVLAPDTGGVFWSWWPDPGPTLGTLVVPDGGVARLAHDEHPDLLIAPGVYTIRRQRRELSGRIELVLD
jgi:hypothetical protein